MITYQRTFPIPAPRLDKALAQEIPDLSRSRLQSLIEGGYVKVDGKVVTDASHKVKAGQAYEVTVPPSIEAEPEAQEIPLNIVYEDDDILVLDKPAGMVVHPAAGNYDKTLVNALLHHCGESLSGIGGVKRPGIVHRLDKDTSGLMVIAKNDLAHDSLSKQFSGRTVEKQYLAIIWGVPTPASGRIEGNIGRSHTNRKKMALLKSGGKSAVTEYKVLKNFGEIAALIAVRIFTGRTHQIRVHMSHIGHPLIGDKTYGRTPSKLAAKVPEEVRAFPRQALHSSTLRLVHPRTGKALEFKSEMLEDMRKLVEELEV